MKSKRKYVLDPGHGGMIKGEYVTAPKKMHTFSDGFVFHEGVFNRRVVSVLADMLALANIDYTVVVTEQKDISLTDRVIRANNIHNNHGDCVYISIHANAGGGKGFEVFTSKGQTESDRLATIMYNQFVDEFPDNTARHDNSDGDPDKEANFYVLRQTKCSAMLLECGFMDNRKEAEWMSSAEGVRDIAKAIFNGIKRIENYTYKY